VPLPFIELVVLVAARLWTADALWLTFRTLFWSSEAILTKPLEESGGRAMLSAYQPIERFVFLGSSS
jgi:hypothetical protein